MPPFVAYALPHQVDYGAYFLMTGPANECCTCWGQAVLETTPTVVAVDKSLAFALAGTIHWFNSSHLGKGVELCRWCPDYETLVPDVPGHI